MRDDSAEPIAPDTAALLADMERLGSRDYSQVGVPMFLIAEDLRGSLPAVEPSPDWREVAAKFTASADTLAGQTSELDPAKMARVIEVFADRHILGADGPTFTALTGAPCGTERR